MFKQMFKGEVGNVFKGMLILLVGAGLARIVGLLSVPILARIYSPEDFGVLALYTGFITILVPVMTLRYVQAIPLPKTDVMAFNLFSVCFKLIIAFSLVLTVVLGIWAEKILGWFDMGGLLPWWWLIVLGVAGAALYELFSLWATRKKDYNVIAKTQFIQSLIGDLVKIGLGILALKPGGLIIGQFLSQSAGVTSFIKNAQSDFRNYVPKIRSRKEKLVAQYYQDYVWYRLPSQFLMVLSVQAPVLMMAALYNKDVTGQLSLAMMALTLPVSLIGNAISKAYYAEIAGIGKNQIEKIKKITFLIQKRLFFIGGPAAFLAYLKAEEFFVFVFGKDWVLAGKYAEALSPFVLLQFTSTPLVQVVNIVGSQKAFLFINVVRMIGLLLIFFISIKYALMDIFFVYAISGYLVVFYLAISIYIFYLMNRSVNNAKACNDSL